MFCLPKTAWPPTYEGDSAPESCPICKAPASKFTEQAEDLTWAAEHVVGVAKGARRTPGTVETEALTDDPAKHALYT